MTGDQGADGIRGSRCLHIEIEARGREVLERSAQSNQSAAVRHQRRQLGKIDLDDAPRVAGDTTKIGIVEEHDVAIASEVAVGLDEDGAGLLRGRDGCVGILSDRVVERQSTVGEDARVRRIGEVRVGHTYSSGVGLAASRGPNAPETPLRASVNSLGMIHSLLDALSLIFGRVCRYW